MAKSRERSSPLSLEYPSSLAAAAATFAADLGHLRSPYASSNPSLHPPTSSPSSTAVPGISSSPNHLPFIFSSAANGCPAAAPPFLSSPPSVGCSSGATSSSVGSLFAGLKPTPFSPPPFAFGQHLSSPPCPLYQSIITAAATQASSPVGVPSPPLSTSPGGISACQGPSPSSPARGDCRALLTGVQCSSSTAISSSHTPAVLTAVTDFSSCNYSYSAPLSLSLCPPMHPNLNFTFGSFPSPQFPPPQQPIPPDTTQQSASPSPCHASSPSPSLKDLPTSRSDPPSPQSKGKHPTVKASIPHRSFRRHPPPPPHGGKGILPTPPLYLPVIPVTLYQLLHHVGSPIVFLMLCPTPFGPLPTLHHPPKRSQPRRTRSDQQSKVPPAAPMPTEITPPSSVQDTNAAPPKQHPTSSEAAPTTAPQCHPITTSSSPQITATRKNSANIARPCAMPPESSVLEATTLPRQGSKSKTQPDTSRSHRRCPRKELLFAMGD